jgi:hypothetical protein
MKASPAKILKIDTTKKRSCDEAGDVGQSSSSPPFSPHPNAVKERKKAKLKIENLLALVNSGFLREKEKDLWRTTTGDPYPMEKNPDEIPMFTRFVERGLALLANDSSRECSGTTSSSTLNSIPMGSSTSPSSCTSARPCGDQATPDLVPKVLLTEAAAEHR